MQVIIELKVISKVEENKNIGNPPIKVRFKKKKNNSKI